MAADQMAPQGVASVAGIQSLDDPRAIQILATEHWGLLASRTMSWNEAFSRASMFLASLSAAVVACALVAQVSGFGQGFVVFVLVILPFVELIGLATFARLGEANGEDIRYIQGMNRIRHAYLESAPVLEPYFVTSHHDDLPAVFSTYGIAPVTRYSIGRRRLHYAFVTTQGMVGIIDSMLAGLFGALVAIVVGALTAAAVGIGILAGTTAFGLHVLAGVSIYERLRAGMTARFPATSPEPEMARAHRWRTGAERMG
jgi:hypothetical protein